MPCTNFYDDDDTQQCCYCHAFFFTSYIVFSDGYAYCEECYTSGRLISYD